MQDRTVRQIKKIISTIIALAAASALIWLLWFVRNAVGNFTDFPEYYAAGKLILTGKASSVYVIKDIITTEHQFFPSLGQRFILIYLPPPAIILFLPIALINLPWAFYLWKVLSFACLAGGVFVLVQVFKLDYRKTCYLIAGVALSHAAFELLRIDQIGSMLFFALCLALYLLQKHKDLQAGLALALFISKPQLILPLLFYLAGLKRWRPLGIFAAVAGVLTLISGICFGQDGYKNYLSLLNNPISELCMQPEVMPTLRGQLLKLFPGHGKEILYISILAFLAVTICSWYLGVRNRGNEKAILWSMLLIIPISLISSLHCHSYDLILLVPAIVMIFTDALISFSEGFKLVFLLASLPFLMPLAILIHYFYLLKGGIINVWFIELLILELLIIMRMISVRTSDEKVINPNTGL